MKDKPRDIVERTFQIAVEVVAFCKMCSARGDSIRTLSRQLLRSATSVGANVEEAKAGQSRADFVSKYGIALKEARETHYWLRLIAASDAGIGDCSALIQEADEIKRILGAIVAKAKSNGRS